MASLFTDCPVGQQLANVCEYCTDICTENGIDQICFKYRPPTNGPCMYQGCVCANGFIPVTKSLENFTPGKGSCIERQSCPIKDGAANKPAALPFVVYLN